jgi:hypothetical protein
MFSLTEWTSGEGPLFTGTREAIASAFHLRETKFRGF